MLFNSLVFFFFLAIVLPTYYFLKTKNKQNVFLLIVSYIFYGYWDWAFCSLLLLSTIVDYFLGLKIDSEQHINKKRWLLIISLVVNLGILGVFKYFNFFIESFQLTANQLGFSFDYVHLNIILPVGISFYTFQTLSYSIDIYRGTLKPTKKFIDFALFVSFFPQLVAGPIEKARDLLPQISSPRKITKKNLNEGIILIVTGLFRKVLIGDVAGRYVDHIFADIAYYKSSELLFAIALFAIQIYADFSGYSKIARGTAKLLGFNLSINFKQPYLANNITDFWRRWHISLSSWLKEYLYFSLGGNKKGKIRTRTNLFITMLLGGLWHGAGANFIIWGGLHGLYLSIHKWFIYTYPNYQKKQHVLFKIIDRLTTLFCIGFAWIFFRLPDFNTTSQFFKQLFNWQSSDLTWPLFKIASTLIVVTFILDYFEEKNNNSSFLLNSPIPMRYGILSALFGITLLYIYQFEALPFIYFQF